MPFRLIPELAFRPIAVALLWFCTASALLAADDQVAVFVLAGQSNMVGQAVVDLDGKDYNEGRGTLVQLWNDPSKRPRLAHLREADGSWRVRNDAFVRYQLEDGTLLKGPLGIGFTAYRGPHHFGPELQFGHVVADKLDSPVLIVKTAWGGKSLMTDFRPPSACAGQPSGTPAATVGPYYTQMIQEVREALANIDQDFPELRGRQPQLAGFVWYHGWNDGVSPEIAVPQYEQNLVHLVHDFKQEFQTPKLPVVIGEITGPWREAPGTWGDLRRAQAAASKRLQAEGPTAFVPTGDFVRAPEDSPNPTHGHHEYGNAETYFLVGDALGTAMAQLLAP